MRQSRPSRRIRHRRHGRRLELWSLLQMCPKTKRMKAKRSFLFAAFVMAGLGKSSISTASSFPFALLHGRADDLSILDLAMTQLNRLRRLLLYFAPLRGSLGWAVRSARSGFRRSSRVLCLSLAILRPGNIYNCINSSQSRGISSHISHARDQKSIPRIQ